jgi:hypothetical protein
MTYLQKLIRRRGITAVIFPCPESPGLCKVSLREGDSSWLLFHEMPLEETKALKDKLAEKAILQEVSWTLGINESGEVTSYQTVAGKMLEVFLGKDEYYAIAEEYLDALIKEAEAILGEEGM